MRSDSHAEMLREVGLVPTIQRLAVLEWLSRTELHPTADQVLSAVRTKFPSISRATVYNTLDALTKAGMVLRLSVDPTVARYDADLEPHAHFRCRVCRKVYDIEAKAGEPIDVEADGHLVESIRTYAYGVCASCRGKDTPPDGEPNQTKESPIPSSSEAPSGKRNRTKESKAPSSHVPRRSNRNEPSQTKESLISSSSVPSSSNGKEGAINA